MVSGFPWPCTQAAPLLVNPRGQMNLERQAGAAQGDPPPPPPFSTISQRQSQLDAPPVGCSLEIDTEDILI